MTAFWQAHDAERAAYKAASHIFALEWRANQRLRLWERPNDDPVCVKLDERIACRHDLRRAHEEAEWRLEKLWNDCSRSLPPLGIVDEHAAYLNATGRAGARALLGAHVRIYLAREYGIAITAVEERALTNGILAGRIASADDAVAVVTARRPRQ